MRDGLPLILLIDDDPDDRALARIVLERDLPRFAVEEVADAPAFGRACGRRSFDLVILELKLGWADGLALLTALKEDWPEVPVIPFTRLGDAETALRATRLGAADYLVKGPAAFLRLPQAVRTALDPAGRRRARPAAAGSAGAAPLESLVDRARMAVFSATPQGRLLNASPGFLQLLGVDDLESANGLDLEPFLAAAAGWGGSNGTSAAAAGAAREVRLRRADGQMIWVEVIGTVVRDGGTTRIDGLVEEITARKETEEEGARESAQLRRANEELLQFASMASHELQEPVRMMERYTQLLKEDSKGKLGAEGDELVDVVIGAAGRLRRLIEDLLALTRVESRERRLEAASIDDLLEETLGHLRDRIEETGAAVTRSPLPKIEVEPSQIVQVLQNLIGNSLKFRGQEPPKVHVAARREGREWIFSVRDNGIGIDPAEAEAVFAIFKRLRTEIPGTGVGLAICRKIVERHGGRIWVESEPGRGSTFYFTIPAS
ncbi:MAG TPA: ATP-binding protein [Thermoanaerobaculia bacterium]|nr:ATP-binding protein [Thermoanaerobaculia bacterium]